MAFEVAPEMVDCAKRAREERGDLGLDEQSLWDDREALLGLAIPIVLGAVVVFAASWLFIWSSVSIDGFDCGTVGATWIRSFFGSSNGIEAFAQGECRAASRSQAIPAVAAILVTIFGYLTFRGSRSWLR